MLKHGDSLLGISWSRIAIIPQKPRHASLIWGDGWGYEEYDFRADGRLYTSSNQQQIESSYIIEREPSASGFYKLEEHILKENGGKDCLDMSQNEDTDYVYYLKFSPSEDQFLICLDESDEECIGYFIRQSSPHQQKLQQIAATTM